jgi:glycosyltransferase involved in cell wall biosynthesis
MKLRFLLHDIFGKGGGVLTVTLALAGELSQHHDVDLVSLFGRATSVHPIPDSVTVQSLIRRGRPLSASDQALAAQPTQVMPMHEPRRKDYSAYTDAVLERYLRSIHGGAVITMQPGLNVALARLGTDAYVRVAQDHRPFEERPQEVKQLYRTYASGWDAFLALTSDDVAGYQELLGTATRVRRMTNGTPPWDGPPSTLDQPLVVAAGRLERSKGFDLLIDAWAQVVARHPQWRLRIYGEGSARVALQQRIADLGLSESVTLAGFSTALQREIARASAFVLSSRAEGYGMVLVEAMACGVPVVSTDCPNGPRDIITDGVDGFLVTNEDVPALAGGILRMIELTPQHRQAMATAAIQSAQTRSQTSVAKDWNDLLTELAAQRAGTN